MNINLMKQSVLLFALLLSFATEAQMKQSTFVFGPKVGLQTNRLSIIDNPTNRKSKLNIQYNVGAFGRLNLGKVSFQTEAFYETRGGNLTDQNQKFTHRNLSVPVLAGVSPFKGLFLEAGPQFSWALNKGWKKEGIEQYGPDIANDHALVAGARIDLLDMFSMFSINLRYVYGLQNTNTRIVHEGSPLDLRTRTFQVSATYNFSEYYKWWRKYNIKKPKN
jgi:hypothetical protein